MHILVAIAAAFGLFQLGALAVLTSVLAFALKGIIGIILLSAIVGLAVVLWRKLKSRPHRISSAHSPRDFKVRPTQSMAVSAVRNQSIAGVARENLTGSCGR